MKITKIVRDENVNVLESIIFKSMRLKRFVRENDRNPSDKERIELFLK
jgi:hypothetical protein